MSNASVITGADKTVYVGRGAEVLAGNAEGEVFLAGTLLQKLTADLEPIWHVELGGRAFALVALPDGGVLAAGERSKPECTGVARYCMNGFITRLDGDGEQRWTLALVQPGSTSRVTGLAMNDGVYYAAGQFSGELSIGEERSAVAEGGTDFFIAAISADGSRAIWVDTKGTLADDGDGPVLAAHPDGGVIAAGHMHDAPSGFVHAFTAAGETRFAFEIHGHVSLFQLVVDGRGHIWTSGLTGGTVEFGDDQPDYVTRGQFDAFVLELDASGALGSLLHLSSPTDGGVRTLGLAPRDAGVWFINDYGYHQGHTPTMQVSARIAVIDDRGEYRELDSFEMLGMFSRHAAITATDGALLWTSAAMLPTTFGLDQGTFPPNRFLMRHTLRPTNQQPGPG